MPSTMCRTLPTQLEYTYFDTSMAIFTNTSCYIANSCCWNLWTFFSFEIHALWRVFRETWRNKSEKTKQNTNLAPRYLLQPLQLCLKSKTTFGYASQLQFYHVNSQTREVKRPAKQKHWNDLCCSLFHTLSIENRITCWSKRWIETRSEYLQRFRFRIKI